MESTLGTPRLRPRWRWCCNFAGRMPKRAIGPGHRVGLLLENRPAFFLHWFALNALGCSIVPLNPDLRVFELSYVISHSELATIVSIPSRHASLREAAGDRPVPIVGPDDPPGASDRGWFSVRRGGPAVYVRHYGAAQRLRPAQRIFPRRRGLVRGLDRPGRHAPRRLSACSRRCRCFI